MRKTRARRLRWLLDPGEKALKLAVRRIIAELGEYQGKTLRELRDSIEELNRQELLEERRRLRLEIAASLTEGYEAELPEALSPSELRQFVFSNVWHEGNGFVTSQVDLFSRSAREYFRAAAQNFNLSEEDVVRLFFADTPEEKLLDLRKLHEAGGPEEIIAGVNLARLKQHLRSAVSLTLRLPATVRGDSPYVAVLLAIKRNKLMGEFMQEDGHIEVTVQGPLTLFSKTTVYGNKLADFTASFLRGTQGPWELAIELLDPGRKKVDIISLDDSLKQFFPASPRGTAPEDTRLRSSDEEAFRTYFRRYAKEWSLVYEGTILVIDDREEHRKRIMVPDFLARNVRTGREVIIEIIGYWRREYLERKIAKVRLLGEKEIILIINTRLRVEDMEAELPAGGPVRLYRYASRTELKSITKSILHTLEPDQ